MASGTMPADTVAWVMVGSHAQLAGGSGWSSSSRVRDRTVGRHRQGHHRAARVLCQFARLQDCRVLPTMGHSTDFVIEVLLPLSPAHTPQHWVKRGLRCSARRSSTRRAPGLAIAVTPYQRRSLSSCPSYAPVSGKSVLRCYSVER